MNNLFGPNRPKWRSTFAWWLKTRPQDRTTGSSKDYLRKIRRVIYLEFPPRLCWRNRVSLESRNGMCSRGRPSESLLMTSPRVINDLLMLMPSLSRSPTAPVWSARSDPARSTRLRWATLMARPSSSRSSSSEDDSTMTLKMVCDLKTIRNVQIRRGWKNPLHRDLEHLESIK